MGIVIQQRLAVQLGKRKICRQQIRAQWRTMCLWNYWNHVHNSGDIFLLPDNRYIKHKKNEVVDLVFLCFTDRQSLSLVIQHCVFPFSQPMLLPPE